MDSGGDGTSNSLEDERALEILKRTTKLKDGRYEVGLLWRNDNPELPSNPVQAEKRLQRLKRPFQRSHEFAAQCKTITNDYIDKGYAVKLSEEEAARPSSHTWYLPHHGVLNPNKSKVRVVYAAARFEGIALNKELLRGRLLNNALVGVLMWFIKDEVAVASDIESMFHRVVSFLELSQARNFSRSKVHYPDLEVPCDWSTFFFPLISSDVSGSATRDEPLRTSAWKAITSCASCTWDPYMTKQVSKIKGVQCSSER